MKVSIEAVDAADLFRQIRDLAGPAVIEGFTDEALLTEVRQRLAKKGFVVVVKPFDDSAGAEENPMEGEHTPPDAPKGKPGRKPKSPEAEAQDRISPPKEGPKPINPASDTAKAMEAPAATQDDVKRALDAYAQVHGQMPARGVIQTVGGSARLMDVPEAKYGALIDALAVKVAA